MATRTISNTGGNWNAVGTWVEGVVPINGDAVVATATSGQLTVNVASACTSIDFTNYTNTLTMTSGLTVSGNVTLVIAMTIAGAGVLSVIATGTLTSNGKTWSSGLLFAGTSQTYTLADAWTVTGTLTCNATTALTVNGSTLNMSGNFTVGAAGIVGTTSLVMNGTGTWSGAGTTRNNLTFNTAGTIIIGSVSYNTGTLTYTTGTVITTGSTLSIAASTTLNTNGIIWNNITFTASTTHTLTSNLTLSGAWLQNSGVVLTLNGFQVNVGSSITSSGAATTSGTTNFLISGNTNINLPGTGGFKNNLTINSSGTVTLAALVYSVGTLTYTAGTMSIGTSPLSINGSCTLNTSGMTWYSILIIAASTITLTSDLYTGLGSVFNFNVSGATTTLNGFTIYIGGSLGNAGGGANSPIFTGTSNFVMTGTGNLGNAITNNIGLIIKNNLTINTAGTITILGYLRYSTGTLTYTAGTVNASTNLSTLQLNTASSPTLNTSGINWYNVTISTVSQTVTINSLLNITNTLTTSVTTIFAGTSGWTTLNFSSITAGVTHTLASTKTYTITGLFTITGTSASRIIFVSSIPASQAILTLTNNGTSSQDIDFCNATDIDSSAGLKIWSYKGVLSNATNWAVMPTQPQTIASAG
jgi:hypothetical protein